MVPIQDQQVQLLQAPTNVLQELSQSLNQAELPYNAFSLKANEWQRTVSRREIAWSGAGKCFERLMNSAGMERPLEQQQQSSNGMKIYDTAIRDARDVLYVTQDEKALHAGILGEENIFALQLQE